MKYFILLTIAMLFQQAQVINLKEYYCGEGVIFDGKAIFPFKRTNFNKNYTPTINEVKKGEDFLFNNYYEYEINILNHFKLDKSTIKGKLRKSENVQKKFKNYNRQYVSYINNENETILYIVLLNFSNKKDAGIYFEGWKESVLVGTGDFYYENQKIFIINLTKNKFIYEVVGMDEDGKTIK